MKKIVENERWEGNHIREYNAKERLYQDTSFDGVIFRYAFFKNCRFERCEFVNCYLGSHVKYDNCTWSECKFTGKYLTFGDDAAFNKCHFENVLIRNASMEGVSFKSCLITGTIRNMIMYGKYAGTVKPIVFLDCDLSNMQFDNINFYGGVDLSSVKLPKTGVRIFSNPNGQFAKALRDAALSLPKDSKTSIEVLGNKNCYHYQNPVLFDYKLLEDILDLEDSRSAFEQIASEYELNPIR